MAQVLIPYMKFHPGNVPVKIVAKLIEKNEVFVRQGIIDGWLPIGCAKKSDKNHDFYISPKLLYEVTGIMWKGEKEVSQLPTISH